MTVAANQGMEPAWVPEQAAAARTNIGAALAELGLPDYAALHAWSIAERAEFWAMVIRRLGIVLAEPYTAVLDAEAGVEAPRWLPGARLNIVASCFGADPESAAIVYRDKGSLHRMSYRTLQALVGRAANGFAEAGYRRGDRIAIAMPMTVESVIAYLGVIAAGGVVVSIADSFAPSEIGTRLRITDPVAVVTQDHMVRGGRPLPMYEKVVAAGARRAIVVDTGGGIELRGEDLPWDDFLSPVETLRPVDADPGAATNILFSSGTTGDPKAIPWSHLTPIKAAMDGHFHQDVGSEDVIAWPTNLGWMMGPWLIYASLINRAALALHEDAPTGRDFGEFVRDAGVTLLGVIPSLVAAWRSSNCMADLDWSQIRRFSSTGEASNPEDMRWLMDLAGNKPVIEYCGGTEIGGAYISGTMVQPAIPATFSTPTLGLDLRIIDEEGRPADSGELFLVPPSIGLSIELLNLDHHDVYYRDLPAIEVPLRRHGDHMQLLPGGYYRALGRVDDAMNLSGIKVSSAEIERAVADVPGITETAAIAVAPDDGGPSRLVIFAVPAGEADAEGWKDAMQKAISRRLNPLFKVHDVVPIQQLPRTASAKVMRRELRAQYDPS